jgi:hypothetical protein
MHSPNPEGPVSSSPGSRHPVPRRRLAGRRGLALLALATMLPGCAALSSLAALRQVDFELAGVGEVSLAGVELTGLRGVQDLSALQMAQVGLAVARGNLPLSLVLDVQAENPSGNPDARLAGLDWELFVDGRPTVTGQLAEAASLPSGVVTPVPIEVGLDLMDFFSGGLEELVDLAIGLAGGGDTVPLRLEATPTVETPIGPIRYPRPLVLRHGGPGTSAAP